MFLYYEDFNGTLKKIINIFIVISKPLIINRVTNKAVRMHSLRADCFLMTINFQFMALPVRHIRGDALACAHRIPIVHSGAIWTLESPY